MGLLSRLGLIIFGTVTKLSGKTGGWGAVNIFLTSYLFSPETVFGSGRLVRTTINLNDVV